MIAIKTPGLHMLSGRDDIAVLWDIRVSPRERGRGTGSALFRAAGTWAEARGCRWLKIETQNVNVRACRFYQKMGCTLGGIDRFAYPAQPAEVQLLWWKALASPDMKSSRPDLRAQPQAAAPASMGQQIGGQAGPGRLQSAYRSCLFSEPRDKGPGQQLAQSRQRNTDTARNWSWQVDEDATEVGMLPKADIRC